MRPRIAAAALLVAMGLLSACGSTLIGSTSSPTCRATADCPSGDSCQFGVFGSCGQLGACIPSQKDASACVPQTACACNGGTVMVCLVNGNATSPIASLGTCDGAVQTGYEGDSSVTDSALPGAPDAADAQTSSGEDSGNVVDTGIDSSPAVDAADSAAGSTYGSPCTTNSQCTDPVYDQCGIDNTCTKDCTHDDQCPDPPTMGSCNTVFDLCN